MTCKCESCGNYKPKSKVVIDNANKIIKKAVQELDKIPVCEECGSNMTEKKGVYGRFYGCSSYPKCKHTEKI